MTAFMRESVAEASPGHGQSLEVAAATCDRQELESMTLDEALVRPNIRRSRIVDLRLQATADDQSFASLVEFQDYSPGWSVAVVVEGGDGHSNERIFSGLRERVEATFQWYSFLSDNRFWNSLLTILGVLVIVALVALLVAAGLHVNSGDSMFGTVKTVSTETGQVISAKPASFLDFLTAQWVSCLAWPAAVLLACIVVVDVRRWLFPKGVFLVGQELHHNNTIRKARWVLLTCLLLPILVQVIA